MKCPYCFYLNDSNLDSSKHSELSLGEIKRISASFGNLLWLSFSGGEIFLRSDISEISRVFYDNNSPSIMLYPTNAMMPDIIENKITEILDYCTDSVIAVKLSLDGVGERHDSIRGTKGSFKQVLRTYELLTPLLEKYANFELGINTVFSVSNQDEMGEIIDFVKTLVQIKTHTISLVRGDIKDGSHKNIDIDKYLSAIELLEDDFRKGKSPAYGFTGAKLKAAQDILQRRLIHKTIKDNRIQIPCYAGKLNIVITETADVFPCESFSMKLGNMRDWEYDIRSMLMDKSLRNKIESIKKNGCFCTHECYLMTNILFNPRMYPALLKDYLKF